MNAPALQIVRVHLLEHRLEGGGSSAVLVRVHGRVGDAESTGVGLVAPAAGFDSDPPDPAWAFLSAAAETMPGTSARVEGRAAASWLEQQMVRLGAMAAEHAVEVNRRKPFRACLAGLEQALLDLVRQVGTGLLEASNRPETAVPGTIPLTATGRPDEDLARLEEEARHNEERGQPDAPLWLDLHGTLDRQAASAFTEAVGHRIRSGLLPSRVILEQPVPRRFGDHLPALQALADAQTEASKSGRRADLRIMASESLWDIADLGRLDRNGGCRALRVHPSRTGGCLASADLARAALHRQPDVVVQVDLPPTPPEYDSLIPHALRSAWAPEPVPAPEEQRARPNLYDVTFYDRFLTPELDNHLIQREALAYGLGIERTSTLDFAAVDDAGRSVRFWWSTAEDTTLPARMIAKDKQVARMLMQRAGVPVPPGRSFRADDRESGVRYAESIGYPVVLKPAVGTGGVGVVADITSAEDLQWAFTALERASRGSPPFIIEKHIHGNDYRIFVLEGRVLSVAQRTPASVIGDGQRTIGELVVAKIALRKQNPHLMTHPIRVNQMAVRQLERQGLDTGSVPARGQRVELTTVANLAQGGDNIEVMQETHPSVLRAAADGVAAIPGLTQAGVDFLLPDHRKPVEEQTCGICEINYGPAQTANETTLYGPAVGISEEMVRRFGAKHGLAMWPSRREEVTLRVTMIGSRRGARLRSRVARDAAAMGLHGWVRNRQRGTEDALLSGPGDYVSSLLSRMMLSSGRASPEVIRAVHTPEQPPEGFAAGDAAAEDGA